MAAGVIRNLAEFRLPTAFLQPPAPQDGDFQELSEEEEEAEEEEEDGPGPERDQAPVGCSPSEAETTRQLLKFSELISCDIQRYFGRKAKAEDPDACNIYNAGCSPRRSGRELYYADLLRLAQGGSPDAEEAGGQLDPRVWRSIWNKDGAQQLGPLAELFDYGLRRFLAHRAADARRPRLEKYAHVTPMHKRKLPQSFWKEPSPAPSCVLNTNPPDFSDLLANWTSEPGQELPGTDRELARPALEMEQFGEL
ncbi:protein PERCC1 [Carettochelys insculpta]|uniref:protein PERCC1 n=1 Tax=Carettochelys insculpta TaxID=44489 RepID=UPI003EBC1D0B